MAQTHTYPNISQVSGRSYTDGSILHLQIENGFIKQIQRKQSKENNSLPWIAPGLIENQVNGFASIDFGKVGLSPDEILKTAKALWATGVTTFLPTIITNSCKRMHSSFVALTQALDDPQLKLSIPGFHLEGPYITPEKGYRGAHPDKYIRPPDWDEFCRFNEAAAGRIMQVTVAPELPGALDFIRKCTLAGIVVGLGHHNADRETIRAAIDHGAKISTHLGNGCVNLIHRHHNVLWPQLDADDLWISIIIDGYHNPPDVVRCFYKIKTAQRIVLTIDAVLFAGMEPGQYEWDGRAVDVKPEGIVMYAEGDSFAGSASSMDKGVVNMMKFARCSLQEAIQMASTNPAKLLKLEDRGAIQIGKRADLILFQLGDDKLNIEKTIVGGRVVY